MKKAKLLLTIFGLTFILCLTACKKDKKEISEKENLKTIKTIVLKKNIEKSNFNIEVLPLVQELYEKDSVKYSMLNHIAKKAAQEKNKEIFKLNVANLKDELKYY
jgi:hypothetical protein